MPISIFVSHYSGDKHLVSLFVRALEESFVIPEGAIRCTSLPGYRLRSGAHTSATLRDEIKQAKILVAILTASSLESGWVMFELGAAWGAQKLVVPVIVDVEYESLPGPLKEINTTDATSRAELEQLFEEMQEALGCERRRAGRRTEVLDELVAEAESYSEDDDSEEDEGGEEE
jgi:hypothetical protein